MIGRVIPGIIAMWAWAHAAGTSLTKVIAEAFGASKTLSESAFVQVSATLFVAYLIGHVISPISSFMHTYVLAVIFPRYFCVLQDAVSGGRNRYPSATSKLFTEEITKLFGESEKVSEAQYRRATYLWYDWIRVANPTAGTRLAKMRAEYRMLEGLYVVTLITVAFYPLFRFFISSATPSSLNLTFAITIALGLALTAWGAARLFRTFQWAVLNHFYQLKSSGPLITNATEANKTGQPQAGE